jgi:myo-inositol 2-dehydrogenase/D-chiro-inositol 1-dehydrogenase
MVGVALLGAGRMGSLHARNAAASPRLNLRYVVDPSADAADALVGPHGGRSASLEEVLADDDIRGVIVASSTDTLLDNALASLRAGKAVFCEKPLSLSLERLKEARAEVLGQTSPLLVGFNRRFDPNLSLLHDRVRKRELGDLETLHIVNHDPAAPDLRFARRSGGLFRDFTVHDFDTAAWLLDEPIDSVFAIASCLIDPELAKIGDVDTAKLILRTASGKLCVISNSRRSGYGYDQRVEAFCERGAIRVDNVANNAVVAWTESGPSSAPIAFAFPDRFAEAYRLELDHFADLIEGNAKPQTGIDNSIHALTLAEAALRSVETSSMVRVQQEDQSHA